MDGRHYAAIPHGSCAVSRALGSQWRNRPHWHVVWPDGASSWCYETELAARDRIAELDAIVDRDTLARIIYEANHGPKHGCDSPAFSDVVWTRPWYEHADAVLASDWLEHIKAEAWDRGYDQGFTDGYSDLGDRRGDDNPYREATV